MNRKYVMTRIATGDYLLPSNDAKQLWRITRSADGTWDVFRFLDGSPLVFAHNVERSLEWEHWECVAQQLDTRSSAIREAL